MAQTIDKLKQLHIGKKGAAPIASGQYLVDPDFRVVPCLTIVDVDVLGG